MKKIISILLIFGFSLVEISCKKSGTNEPPDNSSINLVVEDVSCTEAWLKLTVTGIQLPANISLYKNDIEIQQLVLNTLSPNYDTIIYTDSLLPNKQYKFSIKLITQSGNRLTKLITSETTATTMDTTSHNFSWQSWTFGEHSSSVLYDVAIIDENNIWAVGEIYMKDSLGNYDPHAYNAVHWNGTKWELKRIYFYTICGQASLSSYPAKAIYAFNANDIWVAMDGDQIARISGTTQISKQCLPWSFVINKLWGSNSNNLYAVGNSGNIAHWDGSSWQKIESPVGTSGTELNLMDIYSNGKGTIYISGVNISELKGVVLRKVIDEQFSILVESQIVSNNEIFKPKLYGSLQTVWVDKTNTVYTGGNILYHYKNNKWNYVTSLPENFLGGNIGANYRGYIASIRGNNSNDIIIAGNRNTLKHFNGLEWEQLGFPYSASSIIMWSSVQIKGNTAIAVGEIGNKAIIIMLKR